MNTNANRSIKVTREDIENVKAKIEELRKKKKTLLASDRPEVSSFYDEELLSGADQLIKNEIQIIDNIIKTYENDLRNFEIVEDKLEENQVDIDSIVYVAVERNGVITEEIYRYASLLDVEKISANQEEKIFCVSLNSPIGKALYGHYIGETVIAKLPNNTEVKISILGIEKTLTR